MTPGNHIPRRLQRLASHLAPREGSIAIVSTLKCPAGRPDVGEMRNRIGLKWCASNNSSGLTPREPLGVLAVYSSVIEGEEVADDIRGEQTRLE